MYENLSDLETKLDAKKNEDIALKDEIIALKKRVRNYDRSLDAKIETAKIPLNNEIDKLKNELRRLIEIKRPPAIKEVKRLALMGDFSENAAYQIAKGRLRGINQRILDLEEWLKKSKIIDRSSNKNFVQLGSKVNLESLGKVRTLKILGSSETDPTL